MNNLLSTVTSPTSASRQYKDSVGRFAFQYRCAVRKGLVRKRGQPLGTVVDCNKDFEVRGRFRCSKVPRHVLPKRKCGQFLNYRDDGRCVIAEYVILTPQTELAWLRLRSG